MIRKQLLLIAFLIVSLSAYSHERGHGGLIDGGSHNNDIASSLYFTTKYNYWFNSYVAVSAGASIHTGDINMGIKSPFEEKSTYYILDDHIVALNAIVGARVKSPSFKQIGIGADFDFQFEPIPYDKVYLDKSTSPKGYISKSIYNRFNPSFHIQIAIYYHSKKPKNDLRLAIGYGISNFNLYNAYYRATVDGVQLNQHLKLKPSQIGSSLFLRVEL